MSGLWPQVRLLFHNRKHSRLSGNFQCEDAQQFPVATVKRISGLEQVLAYFPDSEQVFFGIGHSVSIITVVSSSSFLSALREMT